MSAMRNLCVASVVALNSCSAYDSSYAFEMKSNDSFLLEDKQDQKVQRRRNGRRRNCLKNAKLSKVQEEVVAELSKARDELQKLVEKKDQEFQSVFQTQDQDLSEDALKSEKYDPIAAMKLLEDNYIEGLCFHIQEK